MTYIYGIDVAQRLNYCGIVVTTVNERIKIKTIRKLKDLTYPEIISNVLGDLFRRFPPGFICVDYTNEKSFSETLETHLNPSFTIPGSSNYQRWTHVEPVVFTTDMKLRLKQNARELFERELFVWPRRGLTDPRLWSLVDELKEQVLREIAAPGLDGQLNFPKPQGRDNNFSIAMELNLHVARRFLQAPQRQGPQSKFDPWQQYICLPCKNGNHFDMPHDTYWDVTDIIQCPCKICAKV